MSFSELGRRVGLTSPAVAERLRKMEEAGIITGYRADVNPEKVGLSLTAIIGLTTSPDRYPQIITLIQNMPEVLECHHVTGNYSFVMKIIAKSTAHLESAIAQLSQYGSTTTSIVLSSPIKVREITDISNR
jgi:Lrp/AsnC family leucine-responsive transcriptional regulator